MHVLTLQFFLFLWNIRCWIFLHEWIFEKVLRERVGFLCFQGRKTVLWEWLPEPVRRSLCRLQSVYHRQGAASGRSALPPRVLPLRSMRRSLYRGSRNVPSRYLTCNVCSLSGFKTAFLKLFCPTPANNKWVTLCHPPQSWTGLLYKLRNLLLKVFIFYFCLFHFP